MLLWLPKKLGKRHLLLLKFFGVSCTVHGVALLMFFFMYKDSVNFAFTYYTNNLQNNIEVIWMHSVAKKSATKKNLIAPQIPLKKQKLLHPTTLVTNVENQNKKISARQKKKADASKKKNAVKKNTQSVSKKIEKVAPKGIEKIAVVEQSKPMQEIQQVSILPQVLDTPPEKLLVDIREKDAFECYQELREEIAQHFKPPVGIKKDATCQITMDINWEGVIQGMCMDISSGVLMFDIAARNTCNKIKFPKWAYGKSLTIVFKQ